jgi:hypothetical protein
MTVDEQLVLLRKREPVPTGPLAELRQKRLEATRDRLAKVEGIPEARLQVLAEPVPSASAAAPPPTPSTTAASTPPSASPAPAAESPSAGGRVEFGITGESD